jgi:hypothetical protein
VSPVIVHAVDWEVGWGVVKVGVVLRGVVAVWEVGA